MIEQLTPSAAMGLLVVLLGYFIKKWICSLEIKIDRMAACLDQKVNKDDMAIRFLTMEKQCEKKDEDLQRIYDTLGKKCDYAAFIHHSHSDKGIVL